MVCAATSLLSRGPLGVRRWAGRSMCDSLVRRARASSGPGRLGGACARHILHTHQAERAAEPVQSRRSACRVSLLMRLSSDVRRCREELPEAAQRRLPWLGGPKDHWRSRISSRPESEFRPGFSFRNRWAEQRLPWLSDPWPPVSGRGSGAIQRGYGRAPRAAGGARDHPRSGGCRLTHFRPSRAKSAFLNVSASR